MNYRTFSMNSVRITFLILSLILYSSCAEDHGEDGRRTGPGEQATVTVVIKSPGKGSSAGTRAIEDWQENDVRKIDVLLFEPGGKFFASAESRIIDTDDENSRLKNFTVELYQGKFDMVILANAGEAVSGLSFANLTKEDALALLTDAVPPGGKWPTGTGFKPFPMWGDAGTVEIEDGKKISDPVQMLRMVARVDVTVDGDVGNFRLKSVDVYNYNTAGSVAPRAEHLVVDEEKKTLKVVKPNVPGSSGVVTGPLEYDEQCVTDNGCVREIYLMESANLGDDGSVKGLLDRTCLVVGGVWDDGTDPGFSGPVTYYRVDFSDEQAGGTVYWDVLRNHHYTINIIGVSGAGYSDSETAFRSGPADISTEIVSWDESLNEVTWNGQNELSVNKSLFGFHADGTAQTLIIYTDYSGGWEITDDLPENESWIKTDKKKGDADRNTEVNIWTDAYSGQTVREGYLTIVAGTLSKKIKVTQDNDLGLSITINPAGLTFYESGGTKSVEITVSPAEAVVTFSNPTPGDMLLTLPTDNSGNPYRFTVGTHPDRSKGTLTAAVVVTAALNGNVRQEILNITQHNYDLLFEFSPWEKYFNNGIYYYPAIGSTLSEPFYFWGRTARAWELDGAKNPDGTPFGGFTPQFSGVQEPNENERKAFFFELEANDGWVDRPVILSVTSPDENIRPYEFQLWQAYTPPFIRVTEPSTAPYTIDFGEDNSGMSRTVKFTSNSQWSVAGTGDYSNLAETPSPSTGGTNDSSLETNAQEYSVTFRNKILSGTAIPEAGKKVTATVTLSTASPANSQAEPVSVNLTRTIPPYWTAGGLVSNEAAGRSGGTITVKATSNAAWGIQATVTNGTGTKTGEVTAQTYAERQTSVTIPANDTWSDNTINLMYTGAGSGTIGSYSQAGYTLTGASVTGTTTPTAGPGGSATIQINGDYPDVTIASRVIGQTTNLATNTITAGTGAKSAAVSIPASTLWATREIAVGYIHPNGNVWNQLATYTQAGYSASGLTCSGTPEGSGFTVTVTATSYLPALYLRAVVAGTTTVVSTNSPTIAAGTTNSRTQTVTIGSNTGSGNRDVQMQYSTDNSTWTSFGATFSQPNGFVVLSTGRVVAENNALTNGQGGSHGMTWRRAMGLPASYDKEFYPQTGIDLYYLDYDIANGGCAAYSEPGYPAGTWRLPNLIEALEMAERNDELTNPLNLTTVYWINSGAESGDVTYAKAMYGNGTLADRLKNQSYWVRCVR